MKEVGGVAYLVIGVLVGCVVAAQVRRETPRDHLSIGAGFVSGFLLWPIGLAALVVIGVGHVGARIGDGMLWLWDELTFKEIR